MLCINGNLKNMDHSIIMYYLMSVRKQIFKVDYQFRIYQSFKWILVSFLTPELTVVDVKSITIDTDYQKYMSKYINVGAEMCNIPRGTI